MAIFLLKHLCSLGNEDPGKSPQYAGRVCRAALAACPRSLPTPIIEDLATQQLPVQIAKDGAILGIDDPYLRNAHLRVVGQLAPDLERGVLRRKHLKDRHRGRVAIRSTGIATVL